MAGAHWEEFYASHLPPTDFEDNRSLLKEFCDRHNKLQNRIVLVTVRGEKVRLGCMLVPYICL